ncbi:hypothetical protein OsI_29093 [Oryza sativa Indica Group]|uniref:Uncharacterized protein n=2 Tax=Oryza sativa TaxID=4530 RepID=A3BSR0_ORYSJ|nr:hypothetical protein OsI_29093 [Oryza sativa Indica Group]EAZ42599.1 hypothetical protein OsJ_27162 [Oryza sativa Japonica Group]
MEPLSSGRGRWIGSNLVAYWQGPGNMDVCSLLVGVSDLGVNLLVNHYDDLGRVADSSLDDGFLAGGGGKVGLVALDVALTFPQATMAS